MTVSLASNRGIISKDIPQSLVPSTTTTLKYNRPADWLSLPSVGPTDQKFVGLVAVYNNDSNFVAIRAITSLGNFTVDWGDGTSPVSYASGTIAQYKYNFASISSGTLTTRGYRQAIITLTPDTANLVTIDLQQLYVNSPALVGYGSRWLDINLGSPNMTSIILGGTVNLHTMLEQIAIQSFTTGVTFNSLCWGMLQLQSLVINQNTSIVTNTGNMFNNCARLQYIPLFDTSNVTVANAMFYACYSLQAIPQFNLAKVTDMNNMFYNCTSLRSIPFINTSNVTNTSAMFGLCSSLQTIPLLDTSKSTNTATMHQGCISLSSIPTMNYSNTVNAFGMFANTGLVSIGNVSLPNATVTGNLFAGSSRIISIGNIDITKSTSLANGFLSCSSLISVGNIISSNVTSMLSTFSGCTSLNSVPSMILSNVTTISSTFNNCYGLTGVITLDVPKVVNYTSSFLYCNNITTLNFTNANASISNIGSFVTGCNSLVNINGPINCNGLTSAIPQVSASFNYSLSTINFTNVRFATTIQNSNFGKTDLENIFANVLVTPSPTQALTITSNPGADPIQTKTLSGITANSNIVTMTTTANITAGMYLYGTGIQSGIPVTFTTGTNKVVYANALTNCPILNNNRVMFTAIVTTTGISTNTTYYVVNATSTGFQVSLTQGGAAIAITTGTGTMTIGDATGNTLASQIVTVNAGNVIIQGVAALTNASTTLTARKLNTTLAAVKFWTTVG